MTRISFLLALLLTFSGLDAFSQKLPQTERGDRFFDKFDYSKAIYFYEIAYDKNPDNPYVTRQLAKSHDKIANTEQTAYWYSKTIELDSSEPQDMLEYAEALKSLGKYEEAMVWYEKYNSEVPGKQSVEKHLSDKRYYVDLMEDSVKYSVKKLAFNTDKPAFGFTPFDGRFIFSSAGVESPMIDEENPWNHLPYLDLYECELDGNDEFVDIRPMEGAVNSRFHDGPACYDPTTQTLYITRNNMKGGKPVRDKTGTVNLKIYETTFTESGWTDVRELEFNSDEFSNGHPTISEDGQTMYFVSNRPGGFGGTDIYRTEREGKNWSEPENLGSTVNSEGDEMFPYTDQENSLFFASTGHVGLGGLDIFKTMKKKGKWTEPRNLGYPVNTSKDDFSVFYEPDTRKGYFASNRGEGADNIFYFESMTVERKIVAGILDTEDPSRELAGKKLVLENISSGKREKIDLNKEGRFRVEMSSASDYKLMILPDNKEETEQVLFTDKIDQDIDDPYEDIGLVEIPVPDKKVEETPVPADREKPEELTETLPEDSNNTEPESETPVNVSNLLEERNVTNIHFGFDKAAVRDEDVENMNRLTGVMKEDAAFVLKIICHTDSRGSSSYNEKLSKRRAEAAKDFLVAQGIDESRIQISWKGEEELVNNCSDGVKCSAEDHFKNRRGEFQLFKEELPAS